MGKGKRILAIEKVIFLLVGIMYAWFGFQKDLLAVFEIPCMGVIGHYILAKDNKSLEENLNYAFGAWIALFLGKRFRIMISPFMGCFLIGYVLLRYVSIKTDVKKMTLAPDLSVKLLTKSAFVGTLIAILYIVLFVFLGLQKATNPFFFPICEIVTGVTFFVTEVLYLIMLLRTRETK